MQEDLIGYLLGALEPDEMRRVEAWLSQSEDARRQLAELEAALQGLDPPEPIEAPPLDLVARTMASLPPLPMFEAPTDRTGESVGSPGESTGTPGEGFAASIDPMSPVTESGGGSRWTWRDWTASVTAACIVIAIALPSMLEGRFAARKQACQDNLRELGVAMTQFVNRNAEQRLPSIAPEGYQAFAGMYAPRLREAGLLVGIEDTLCPSLSPDQFWPMQTPEVSNGLEGVFDGREGVSDGLGGIASERTPEVVTLTLLEEVGRELMVLNQLGDRGDQLNVRMLRAIERLRWMQTTAGGHYSYTLGVRDGDVFASPRFQGRSSFAVMSDAVIIQNGHFNDRGNSPAPALISHGGRGINVLYEDGRVGFMTRESLNQTTDHPLFNHAGQTEAGLTIDDASLAPSWQPPFIRALQR